MSSRTTDHDRAPGGVDRDPGRPRTSRSLDGLRLNGAVFLRAEYTESWAFESMPVERPRPRRWCRTRGGVTLFHVVAAGRCWVEVGTGGAALGRRRAT